MLLYQCFHFRLLMILTRITEKQYVNKVNNHFGHYTLITNQNEVQLSAVILHDDCVLILHYEYI
jgi:hypothetical protein